MSEEIINVFKTLLCVCKECPIDSINSRYCAIIMFHDSHPMKHSPGWSRRFAMTLAAWHHNWQTSLESKI